VAHEGVRFRLLRESAPTLIPVVQYVITEERAGVFPPIELLRSASLVEARAAWSFLMDEGRLPERATVAVLDEFTAPTPARR
jgi:hypothetical protein